LKKNLTPNKRPELKMRKKAPGRILLISPHFLIYYWKGKIMFNSLGFYLT
jgi:hypothetical protein